MRIAIVAPGSRGDVEPYLALGKGLAAAGHAVRLVTHGNFAGLAAAHGVEFWPIVGDSQQVAQGQEMSALLERGNFAAILARMAREAERGAVELAEGGLAACRGMDAVLAGVGGLFVGYALAEKLDLAFIQAHYIPFTPTRAYPSFLLPGLPSWLGGALNRPSYHLARQMMWQPFRAADRLVRQKVLGLPPSPLAGPFRGERFCRHPVLYGFSPAVIPPPDDGGPEVHVTGYWFLDAGEDWTPPPTLAAFLQSGPPPVYIGFGSMSISNPAQTAGLIVHALRQTGERAVVLAGWGGLQVADLPDSVFMLETAPFAWLFPRMAAVVHHGGAGTTAAGLRAGVPSVVVPFFGDQPFWGRRVADLGVGPAPIPRKQLTAERLAAAIHRAVTDAEMRRRAADLGRKIRAEDGIARAVAVVARVETSLQKECILMSPIKLLIIGAGSRGANYAEYAHWHPDQAQVVGVAEPREHYRAALAARHGIPAGNVYADWREAAAQPRFADAVIIATPDALHTEPAVAFAERGYHILLEKPMAPTAAECRQIAAAAQASGAMFAVCHVLRYTAYTKKVKAIVDSGRLGEIASIQHLEPVGFWHQAHSFVRGNWRNEAESSSMLLAKSCHDLDWLRHIMGRPCTLVSSFGSLLHFRPENRPAGAADRCLDCAVETSCPYSAPRIYLTGLRRGITGWPLNVLTPDVSEAGLLAALRTGPYGRCVYACDNDVVDHQVVAMQFEGGATASFTMTAFNRQRDRETRIFGTRGELYGNGRFIEVYDFMTDTTERIDAETASDGSILSGHGGGDLALMTHFVGALRTGDPSLILSGPAESLETHLMVFAAEQARREGRVVGLS